MSERNEIILYQPNEQTKLEVRLENETVWLSQAQMAELFQRAPQNITMHIRNIYAEGELDRASTCKDFLQVQQEGGRGVRRIIQGYNLDVIISVGYRVHSIQGTRFRQWAIQRLKEYIVRGYSIDVERLKGNGGGAYWYDLLNTIKDIRSSEKVLYRQVLDLYATSVDYNASAEETRLFFKIVQNKLHYAFIVSGKFKILYKRRKTLEKVQYRITAIEA